MTTSPVLTENLTTGQKYDLLKEDDFITACLADGLEPREVLGLPLNPSRSTLCLSPVVLDKVNVETGEASTLVIPCGTSNALKCPSCAEFSARLRTRQIMNGLEPDGTQTALLTLTAPSFGKVHRSSYTVKDAFKVRKKHPREQEKHRLSVMKMKGKCSCGNFHDWTDHAVGTPFGSYDYAREIIWNENLPSLAKATTMNLKRRAEALGIAKDDFSIFAVWERQKRGALHQHILLCVKDNSFAFDRLIADIKTDWESPTSVISPSRLRWYRSADAKKRWAEYGPSKTSLSEASIPRATWKSKEDTPATSWGEIYDIRVLAAEQDENSLKVSGYEQAAHYLAKYLTKNQAAFSPEGLDATESYGLERHYLNFRRAALALCGDRIIAEALVAAAKRDIADFCEKLAIDGAFDAYPRKTRHLYKAEYEQKQARLLELKRAEENLAAGPYLTMIAPKRATYTIDKKFTTAVAVAASVPGAARSLAIRLNKMLDNGGFTGTLTSITNWNTTLTSLKAEMKSWVGTQEAYIDPAEYDYSLNFDEMRKLFLDRCRKRTRRPANLEAIQTVFFSPPSTG
jgi:hypothetical protein